MRGTAEIQRPPPRAGAADSRARTAFAVALVLALYALWVAATYLLEGRTRLFERFDPPGRALYALVANVLVGTVLSIATARALRLDGAEDGSTPRGVGSRLALALTFVLGAGFAVLRAPAEARDPIVVVNAFAQVLPTSIAEIAVCWILVGGAVRASTRGAGRIVSTLLAVLAADLAFALYHVAHSPPFDQPKMMLFLAIPGLVIGAIVFVARDVYVALVAQNFFAVLGILQNADTGTFRHPFVWAYAIAALAAAAFVASRRYFTPPFLRTSGVRSGLRQ